MYRLGFGVWVWRDFKFEMGGPDLLYNYFIEEVIYNAPYTSRYFHLYTPSDFTREGKYIYYLEY
jgi:hypothetical protein